MCFHVGKSTRHRRYKCAQTCSDPGEQVEEAPCLPSGVQTSKFGLVGGETMTAEKDRSEPSEASCSAAAAWSWLAFRSSRRQRRPSLNKSVNIFVFWRTQHRIDVNSLVHISACSCSISHTSCAFHPLVGRHRFCSAYGAAALCCPPAVFNFQLFSLLVKVLAPCAAFWR